MAAYYSSDEEVSWGPISLREIKRDLRRPPLKKVVRRHTYSRGYMEENCTQISEMVDEREAVQAEGLQNKRVDCSTNDVTDKCNSSGTSQYFTSNEAVQAEVAQNKKMHLPSIVTDKCNSSGTSTQYFTPNETHTSDHLSSGECNQLRITQWNPEYQLDNCQLTLVDNYSKDSLEYSAEQSDIGKNNGYDMNEGSIIVLSSDESGEWESYSDKNISKSIEPSMCSNISNKISSQSHMNALSAIKREASSSNNLENINDTLEVYNDSLISCDNNGDCESSSLISVHEGDLLEEYLDLPEQIPGNLRYSTTTSSTVEQETNHFNRYSNVTNDLEQLTIDQMKIKQPVCDRDSSDDEQEYDQREDCATDRSDGSYNSEDGDCLNTTMDEIDRLLNLEPKSPSTTVSKPQSHIPLPINPPSTNNSLKSPCTRNHLKSPLMNNHLQTPSKNNRLKSPCTSNHIISPSMNNHLKTPTTDNCFKVPQLSSSKHPKQNAQNINMKKIVSPVGVYMNYSPHPYLKLNVCKSEERRTPLKITPSKVTPKIIPDQSASLPQRIYKPSKSEYTSTRKNLFLPPSIAKLVKEPQSTKHEGRRNPKFDDSQVEMLLSSENDLTRASINDSNLNESNAEVSILVKKNTIKY